MTKTVNELIDARGAEFEVISDSIWDNPELNYKETHAVKLHVDKLKAEGFRVTCPAYGISTSYCAEFGAGKPVIALLGEYDALANLSQAADLAEHRPIIENGPGHGCGHNLLGVAAMEAAVALKTVMERDGLPGTIRCLGCPAEEGGGGKVFMIRAGAFEDVDCVLTWHGNDKNGGMNQALAVVITEFSFIGKASHASAAPEKGRSALDAAELMNIGTQFLREHVTDDVRIHYAFLNDGGPAANVVHAAAKMQYVIRAKKNQTVVEVFERIRDIAKGAALMTGTTSVEPVIVGAYADHIRNETLAQLCTKYQLANLPISYTDEELAYAASFQKALGVERETPMYMGFETAETSGGSTDVADVSWVVPTAAFYTATTAWGSVPHGWSTTAQGKSAVAHKGMHHAAKVMASCTLELLGNPALVAAARADFDKALGGASYRSLLPEDAKPE